MRSLVEEKILDLWMQGYDEMTNVAYTMGWNDSGQYEVSGSYQTRVNDWILIKGRHSTDLIQCMIHCTSKALLIWLEAQLCQKYR